jgi:hypothetical protein
MNWIINNKEWLFSGLGITIITLIFWFLRHYFKEKPERTNKQTIGNIQSKGNVTVYQTINNNNNLKDQIEVTFMALK